MARQDLDAQRDHLGVYDIGLSHTMARVVERQIVSLSYLASMKQGITLL